MRQQRNSATRRPCRGRSRSWDIGFGCILFCLISVAAAAWSQQPASAYESVNDTGYVKLGLDKLPDEGEEHRIKLTVFNDGMTSFRACGETEAECATGSCSFAFSKGCFLGFNVFGYREEAGNAIREKFVVISGTPRKGCSYSTNGFEWLECVIRRNAEEFKPDETEAFVLGFPRGSNETLAHIDANLDYACNTSCTGLPNGASIPDATLEYKTPATPVSESNLPSFCRSYAVPRGSVLIAPAADGLLSGTESANPTPTSVRLSKISFGRSKLDLSTSTGEFRFLASAKTSQLATMEYDLLGPDGKKVGTGKAYINIGAGGADAPQGCGAGKSTSKSAGSLKKQAAAKAKRNAKLSKAKSKKVAAGEGDRSPQGRRGPPELDQELYDCNSNGTKCYWMYSARVVTKLAYARKAFEIKNYCLQFDVRRLVKCDWKSAVFTIWNDLATKQGLEFAANRHECYGGKTTIHTGALFWEGDTVEDGPNESPVLPGRAFEWPMYSSNPKQTGLRCSAKGFVVRVGNGEF